MLYTHTHTHMHTHIHTHTYTHTHTHIHTYTHMHAFTIAHKEKILADLINNIKLVNVFFLGFKTTHSCAFRH